MKKSVKLDKLQTRKNAKILMFFEAAVLTILVVSCCLIFAPKTPFSIKTTNTFTASKTHQNAPISTLKDGVVFADSATSQFAKVKDNCTLYKTETITNNALTNIYFTIPKGYFVTILATFDAAFKVKYGDIIGFIDKQSVNIVSLTPKQPTLIGLSFAIKPEAGTQIRQTPTAADTSNILSPVPANSQNITYIAQINGEIPTGGVSDVWYYAEFTPTFNPTCTYRGYIYSERATGLPPIPNNLENDVLPNTDTTITSTDETLSISPATRGILIALICLPVVIVFVLMLAKHAKNKREKTSIGAVNQPLNNAHTNPNTAFFENPPRLNNHFDPPQYSALDQDFTRHSRKQKGKFSFTAANKNCAPAPINAASQITPTTSYSQASTAEPSHPRRTIKAFKNKQFVRASKVKSAIDTALYSPSKATLDLDRLDDDEDLL